jgi:hypothetical protein
VFQVGPHGSLGDAQPPADLGVGVPGGVGTGLLEEAKRWAAARGLHRIELNVMAHNHRAIALYERAGFVREGRRVDCLLVDGKFLDELYGRDPARLVTAVTVMTALKRLGPRGSGHRSAPEERCYSARP